MGKEWLMLLILAVANDTVAQVEPPKAPPSVVTGEAKTTPPNSSSNANGIAPKAIPPIAQPKCEVAPYRSLVGRTISDVLTMKLPPGTRIYRIGDPVTTPVPPGRLNIEINRGTRVGRIYCS